MLEINDLSYSFNSTPLIRDCNFTTDQGEVLGIIGPSGCGKTSLLRLIAGSLTGYKGSIQYNDTEISAVSKKKLKKDIRYHTWMPLREIRDSVYGFLLQARAINKRLLQPFSEIDRQEVEHYIEMFTLNGRENDPVYTLSESEQSRILVAYTMLQGAHLLLLDNPDTLIDIPSRIDLIQAVKRYVMDGDASVILTSQDINLIINVADRIALCKDGQITDIVLAQELTEERLKDTFGIPFMISRNIYSGLPEVYPY